MARHGVGPPPDGEMAPTQRSSVKSPASELILTVTSIKPTLKGSDSAAREGQCAVGSEAAFFHASVLRRLNSAVVRYPRRG